MNKKMHLGTDTVSMIDIDNNRYFACVAAIRLDIHGIARISTSYNYTVKKFNFLINLDYKLIYIKESYVIDFKMILSGFVL